jgi:hypothetical protein
VRVSFYEVPNDGCIALLLQGTSCQYGQSGCPSDIVLAEGNFGGWPGWTTASVLTTGWTTLTVSQAATICANNAAPGAGDNSVEFDYSL